MDDSYKVPVYYSANQKLLFPMTAILDIEPNKICLEPSKDDSGKVSIQSAQNLRRK